MTVLDVDEGGETGSTPDAHASKSSPSPPHGLRLTAAGDVVAPLTPTGDGDVAGEHDVDAADSRENTAAVSREEIDLLLQRGAGGHEPMRGSGVSG